MDIAKELAEEGREVAAGRFSDALYDGKFDVTITVEQTETGSNVVAKGESVAFVEFGTGVYYGDSYIGRRPPEIAGIGQFGKGKGMRNTWAYIGEAGSHGIGYETTNHSGKEITVTRGNPPANAMANAVFRMKDDLVDTARRVFNE